MRGIGAFNFGGMIMTADFCGFICSLFAMHHLLRFCNSMLQFNSRSVRDKLLRNRQVSSANSRGLLVVALQRSFT